MIKTHEELRELTARALHAQRIAIDTEFLWERTFYPILGVVQIGFSETDSVLIDAPALPGLPGFGAVLESRHTEKILHDAQQDLAILARVTSSTPCNIFDTRRAAGFAGFESTLSLANLLKKTLDIEIPKTETRSNWLQRPLTQNQIAYALNDVRFLPELRDLIRKRAEDMDNLDYLNEEMRIYDKPEYFEDTTALEIYSRFNTARMSPPQRAALLELIRWRENTAKRRNIPRNFILKNADLAALARALPQSAAAIKSIQGLPRSAGTRYLREILESIQSGLKADAPDAIATSAPAGIKEAVNLRIKQIAKKASDAGIDPALIGSRKDITALVTAEQKASHGDLFDSQKHTAHPLQSGWRANFI